MVRRRAAAGAFMMAIAAVGVASVVSPWPMILTVRAVFAVDAAWRNRALERHVPPGVGQMLDVAYGPQDDARLDVFTPPGADAQAAFPVIVWVHGGGFVAGNKRDVAPYLKILASRGYVAIGVGYPVAPGARYPAPVVSANEALRYVLANAERFRVDSTRIVLAGDSAGAHIATQLGIAVTNPAYAGSLGLSPAVAPASLRGVVLFCGIYDLDRLAADGFAGRVVHTVISSYFGAGGGALAAGTAHSFAVARHMNPDFPRAFVSVGNGDALAPQSRLLAEAMRQRGLKVETLFFPPDHAPALPHEYQFNLDGEAGQVALARLTAFLADATR